MTAMDYSMLMKKLGLPGGFAAPARLTHDDVEARAIPREHLSDDVRGINASLALLRRTRLGGWPGIRGQSLNGSRHTLVAPP